MNRFKAGFWLLIVVCIILPFIYVGMVERPPSELSFMTHQDSQLHAREILPLPQKSDFNAVKAEIGKRIWFNEGKCESCHHLANSRPAVCFEVPAASCRTCHVAPIHGSGGDGQPLPSGLEEKDGGRNTLSVWNSRYNIGYGWDGREFELGSFIASHMNDPKLFTSMNRKVVIEHLNSRPEYREAFAKLGVSTLSLDAVSDVLGEYVKSLVAPDSRFDRYLRGETDILTSQEKNGYAIFKKKGCIVCHNGVNIGGNSFKIFGTYKLHKLKDPFGWYTLLNSTYEDENLRKSDKGIYRITKIPIDNYRFRVASLRNVDINRPYFTQGQVWELSEAIRTMGRVQLGVELSDNEVIAIEAFLGTLTGRIPAITSAEFTDEVQ